MSTANGPAVCPDGHAMDDGLFECPACGAYRPSAAGRSRGFEPRAWRDGWRAALSGGTRDACRYTAAASVATWNEGYRDAERERAKDVRDVRAAVGWRAAT